MLGVCSLLGNKKPRDFVQRDATERAGIWTMLVSSSVKGRSVGHGDQLEDLCGSSAKGMETQARIIEEE